MLFTLFVLSIAAWPAEAVTIVGSDGATGVDGVAGAHGQDGGAGESVEAIDMIAVGNATADATGGAGGTGGRGGEGLAPGEPGSADGGAGGLGGSGGNARAEAGTNDGALVEAVARGGNGGSGGAGGRPLIEGSGNPGSTAVSGAGGDADARATLVAGPETTSSMGSQGVDVTALAIGGNGGSSGASDGHAGAGGAAYTQASGSSTGGADVRVNVEARGGAGGLIDPATSTIDSTSVGGDGGDARLVDSAFGSTSGTLSLSVVARGGNGGESSTYGVGGAGGNGGSAHVSLDQENTGGGDLVISVESRGGNGGDITNVVGGDGGAATLGPIVGRSSNGAAVSVSARTVGGDAGRIRGPGSGTRRGGSVRLIDAVQAFTSGDIFLSQRAQGGESAGIGGDVYNELNSTASASSLTLRVSSATEGGRATAIGNGSNDAGDTDVRTDISHRGGSPSSVGVANANGTGDVNAVTTVRSDGSGTERVSSNSVAMATGGGTVVSGAQAFINSSAQSVTVNAFGSNQGAGQVDVLAGARFGSISTDVDVSAEGHSIDGDVNVSAFLTSALGPPVRLQDAVTGSTAGTLTLSQFVRADAHLATSLVAVNDGGGDLALDVTARSLDLVRAANQFIVFLGDVIGTSDTGADVSIDVSAAGNIVQQTATTGGNAPSRVFGESNGGAVRVAAEFSGLLGARGTPGNDGRDGQSVAMVDVARGATSGQLTLVQEALAGDGGAAVVSRHTTPSTGSAGAGGNALSEMRETTSSKSLTLHSTARGGNGGISNNGPSGDGGAANAIADGVNNDGRVHLVMTANGGLGTGRTSAPPFGLDPVQLIASRGGDAVAEGFATSRGDGQGIVIGDLASGPLDRQDGASGGSGGTVANTRDSVFGDGGDATSRSLGIAEGNSRVTASDRAVGGTGGRVIGPLGGLVHMGGSGGDAQSQAIASGAGVSSVLAVANARGGDASSISPPPFGPSLTLNFGGDGGAATAYADASGLGQVKASATATGGFAGAGNLAAGIEGAASAVARARGASGYAAAEAISGSGLGREWRTMTRSSTLDVGAVIVSEAHVSTGQPRSVASSMLETGVRSALLSQPVAADKDRALAANPALAAAFVAAPNSELIALGEWDARHDGSSKGSVSFLTEIDLELGPTDIGEDLLLSVFETSVVGNGFEELRFRVERSGELFLKEAIFTSVTDAILFLEGSLFEFGSVAPGESGIPSLRVIIEATLGAGDGFGLRMGYATSLPVPEPGTAVLMGVGLLCLSLKSRRVR